MLDREETWEFGFITYLYVTLCNQILYDSCVIFRVSCKVFKLGKKYDLF